MRISHSSYSKYIKNLSKEITGEKLFSPLLFSYKTIVFPFLERKGEVLIIDLNSKQPLFFKANNDCFFSSFESKFNQTLKKYVGRSTIVEISLVENDLVVMLKLQSTETLEIYTLVIQLIPNNPNLFLLDEKGFLIEHIFSSLNFKFRKGRKLEVKKNDNFFDGETEIDQQLFNNLLLEEKQTRAKEKFGDFTKYIKSKINRANKRIKAIHNDIEIAGKNLIFKEIADYILSSEPNLKIHKNSIEFEGNKYEIDSAKTLLENVNHLYKKSKKAKETISRSEENIQNAIQEIETYKQIEERFNQANEKERDELVQLYLPSKTKKETKPTFMNRPWKVNFNGTIIYFGKSASQNDYLSFSMKLDREFTWFHIKDKSGAHLVIANKKPTENELLTAAELSLLCSQAKAGEVSYTKKKNVRRGHVTGEALIKNYSNIRVNNIRKETIDLFAKAVRCD